MRIALVWSGLGLGFFLAAVRSAPPATGVGWASALAEVVAGLCSVTLAVLYASRAGGWPVEAWFDRPGRAALPLKILLGPYRALAWATLLGAGWLGRERPVDEVAPGLFVGRRPFAWERDRLEARGVAAVLDLCAELPSGLDRGPAALPTRRCPILDGTPPTPAQFEAAVDWVAARRAEGRGVLIHCAQGHGRGATVAAVVLVRTGMAADLDEALGRVRRARPGARPSRGQRRAAAAFLGGPAAPGRG